METVYFKGQPCHTYGTLPQVDSLAPCFHLTGRDLSRVQCLDFKDKTVVLNIFPSLDTEVCARSVRRFNEEAAKMPDTAVICVSMDLPLPWAASAPPKASTMWWWRRHSDPRSLPRSMA